MPYLPQADLIEIISCKTDVISWPWGVLLTDSLIVSTQDTGKGEISDDCMINEFLCQFLGCQNFFYKGQFLFYQIFHK